MEVRSRKSLPPHAEPMLITELYNPGALSPQIFVGKSVNVTGRLDFHDVSGCRAQVVDPKSGSSICIDTSFVEPFEARMGSLFQFVGELQTENDTLTLKARVVRCVEGLDLHQYEKAVETQRKYLALQKT